MIFRKTTDGKGFTLLELLVVIAVIGLLAGMLLPVLSRVRHYAKKAATKEIMYELETAFKQYLVDYRKFPDYAVTQVDSNVLSILAGDTNGPMASHAYLEHQYLDVTTNEQVHGIVDPWNQVLMLTIDNGRGGDSSDPYDRKATAGPYGDIEKEVVIWSKGKDGLDTDGNQKDDIRSWD